MARAEALAPEVLNPPLWAQVRRWGLRIAFAAVLIWSAWDLGLLSGQLLSWSDVAGRLLSGMLRPNPAGHLDSMLDALLETMGMAIAGTVLALSLSIPMGIVGAKTVIGHPVLHGAIRLFFNIFRGIPSLIWAIIMIRAFGLGPMGGVMSLALAESVYLAKLFAESIENADRKPMIALRAAGAGPLQAIRYGLMPQIAPNFIALGLFFLEVNMRAAAALGLVGAGGIGQMLEERLAFAAYDQVAFILLLLLVMVAVIDTVSTRLRRWLTGGDQPVMG